jgi:glycosyltransferase 2 family protein
MTARVGRLWPRVRLLAGVLMIGALVWRFGTGPFSDAWEVTTWGSVALSLVLTAVATLANAWRWRVVSRAFGVPITTVGSIVAYYRSQFLNSVLPGGVLGDAHRGTRQGRDVGDLGAGLRSTAWDRVTGQLVQAGLVVLALGLLATPLRAYTPVALAGLATVVVVAWWLGRRRGTMSFVGRDLRILLRPPVAGRVACASCLSTAAYIAVFAVAMQNVGVSVGPTLLVPVALLVLVGSAIPLNVAGWGPREGLTAAVFALAGLGSADGLTVSVVFGVLAAVATIPGLLVLLADVVVRRRCRPATQREQRVLEGAGCG